MTLLDLPVTGAPKNSYLLRITGIGDMVNDGKTHTVKITVQDKATGIASETTFDVRLNWDVK